MHFGEAAFNGPVSPAPTTYGVNIGHYDYATDVNAGGTGLGFMDGPYSSAIGLVHGRLSLYPRQHAGDNIASTGALQQSSLLMVYFLLMAF